VTTETENKTDLSTAAPGGSDVVVIYHKGCSDGFCAAWLLHKLYPDATFLPKHPGMLLLTGEAEGKHVIVADLSFSPNTTLWILEKAKSFLCLDHHRTAAERLDGIPGCHFDENKSGARMVWDYFGKLRDHFGGSLDLPWLVAYTEDRDLWRWKLPLSRQVNAALRCFDYDFAVWDSLGLTTSPVGSLKPYAIVTSGDEEYDGHTLVDYHAKKVASAASRAIEVEVPIEDESTLVVPCVNIANSDHTSDVGEALAKSHESQIGLTYYHDGYGFRFSIRSVGDADAGRIAEFNGGGGHKHAAGFFRKHFLPVFESEDQ